MSRLTLCALLLFSLQFTAQAKSCYFPDGTNGDPTPSNRGTVPCNTTSTNSACCDPWDSCTTSGLCLGASGWIYRSGCTDPTWQAPECSSLCQHDPITNVKYPSFAPIYPCPSVAGTFTGNYCCQSSNGSCCKSAFQLGNTGIAFKYGTDGLLASLSSASAYSATASPTSGPTSTITITATATNTPSSSSSSALPLGTAVGIGVGIPLAFLAAGILAFLFWREARRDREFNAKIAAKRNSGAGTASAGGANSAWTAQGPVSQPGLAPSQLPYGQGQYNGSEMSGASYQGVKIEGAEPGVLVLHEMRG